MDLSELIVAFREDADDAGGFQLYDDTQAARWAAEGELEAALRARLLRDDSSDFTSIAVLAGQAIVELDPAIFAIDTAAFTPTAGGRPSELDLVGMDWIEDQCDWRSKSCSRPGALAHYERSRARIWETPSVAGTLALAVYRLPLNPIEDPDDEPEIAVEHHRNLVDWMLYRAYGMKDSEQYDVARSAAALARFEVNFGTRDTANVMRRHRERRRITTRPI